MQDHYKLSDTEFEKQFSDCSLNPEVFTHEAHLRLAWVHIKKYGVARAVENVKNQIINYVNYLGEADKYNETVTIAGVKMVHHFMLKTDVDNFSIFIDKNGQLMNDFKGLIQAHYKTNIFKSEIAKHQFIEPEKLPFD